MNPTSLPLADASSPVKFTESEILNFFSRVNKSESCWLWTSTLFDNGYGSFHLRGRTVSAHRASYMIHFGEIPNDLCVCHRCDVRNCVRPEHLFLGTRGDNNKDCAAKGRSAKGDKNGKRKYPEKILRGEDHPLRKNPSLAARGENSARKLHPDSYRHGEDHPDAILTEENVRYIRCQYVRYSRGENSLVGLAERFGVSISTIQHVVKAKSWKRVIVSSIEP